MIATETDIRLGILERHAKAAGLKSTARIGVFGSHCATKADDGKRGFEIETVATTDDVDSQEEVVLPTGLDMTYLATNRKVFADHMYGIPHTVAKLQWIKAFPDAKTPRGFVARATLINDDTNPYVRAIKAMAADPEMGIGMSIGFEATEWGPPSGDEKARYPGAKSIVRRARLLELSYTALPANVACQGGEVRVDGRRQAVFERLCRKGLIPASVAGPLLERARAGMMKRRTTVFV